MAILGATLKTEIVEALGLDTLKRDLRRELRAVMRELRSLKGAVKTLSLASSRGQAGAPAQVRFQASPTQIRAARQALGDSRKAFAERLGVSSGIVFAWETGRSAPRRRAIVARLEDLLLRAPGGGSRKGQGSGKAKPAPKLTAKRRARLRIQGQYMGLLRSLSRAQQADVKQTKAASGYPQAIRLARRLRRG